MFKGALHVGYTGGSEEVLKAGEVTYRPPGHTVWTTDEDTAMLIPGPEEEELVVIQHIEERQDEFSQDSP